MFQKILLMAFFVSMAGAGTNAFAGRVDLTTYYPAPTGEYQSVETTKNDSWTSTPSAASPNVGSINLTHPTAGSLSMISFQSARNPNSDTGYIVYYDDNNTYDYWPGGTLENSALVIGVTNDGAGANSDVVVLKSPAAVIVDSANFLMPSGNVGIGTTSPGSRLTVAGGIAGGETTTGWVLGQGAWGPDNWLRLTRTQGGNIYHDLAVANMWINDHVWVGGVQRYDLAEMTPIKEDEKLERGDVVVIDRSNGLRVVRSFAPYDTAVYGVVSSEEQAALTIGGGPGPEKIGQDSGKMPIALIGRIKAKVSAENGPIGIGDLLTTSATPGHLMKCSDKEKCFGAIAGKALEPWEKGEGVITILATLQ